MIEHIQNSDKVLANLKQAKITIFRIKSQFCWANMKIVRYICDADSCYPNISKLLKILNYLKYTNTTLIWEF